MVANFFLKQLQDLLVNKARGGLKTITTIQSETALSWVIGFIVYVVFLILGASITGRIPGLYHVIIIYPFATYGAMSMLNTLAHWSDEEKVETLNGEGGK